MILLRNNLLSAAKSPEKPNIRRLKKEMQDEVGVAIRIANDLIRANANNLIRLRSQAEDKIHKLAYFDALTGLPNRTSFLEKLEDGIRHKVLEEDGKLAVFSVDLDHFKDINDTMGHEIGDKLLEAIGKRLVKCLPEDAVVSRASADEFTVMAYLRPDQPHSSDLVERVFTAMVEPVSILQERFQVRVSIGVAHCPDDGIDARQILKNADIALNRAKSEGRDTVRYYSQDFDIAIQHRFQMLRDLRTAMDQKQLKLFYHPQFDLKSGRLIGAEALLRWWKPDASKEGGKYISPAEFIPVAEQSGLIVPIGEYVLRTACETSWAWRKSGLPPIRIAVNISGVQFHRGDIVNLVTAVLQETQMEPRLLELEVTESVFMENMQAAIDILNQLHELGVELAVDDFGTGYSSLSYLRQFPIDRLKIDQSFIRNALVNPDDRMIAKTIITLGHSLGLKVIAEGVETQDHENFLKEDGCDESQGFKYTKPIPDEEFRAFATAHNRSVAKGTKLSLA
jgi:diguanylate cyclase (GGDEF)-like protein